MTIKTKTLADLQPGEKFVIDIPFEGSLKTCTAVTTQAGLVTKIHFTWPSGLAGVYSGDHLNYDVKYIPVHTEKRLVSTAKLGDQIVGKYSGNHYRYDSQVIRPKGWYARFIGVITGGPIYIKTDQTADFIVKEKTMTKPKTKTATFLASLKVGDKFRFLKGKPENNYTVLYTDTKGTLYRSNLYPSDTFFVSNTEPREVTTKLIASRSEIIPIVNQLVDLLRQEKDLLQKLKPMGGTFEATLDNTANIFTVEAFDASGKPIKVTL